MLAATADPRDTVLEQEIAQQITGRTHEELWNTT